MKILQINKFFYDVGGTETHYFDLCNLLSSHGHEVIHFSTQSPENKPSPYSEYFAPFFCSQDGMSTLNSFGKLADLIYSRKSAKALEKLILKTKPDIAHLHNIYHQLSPSILSVLKKYKIPTVMTLHDLKFLCPNYKMYTEGQVCERCKRYKYYEVVKHKCMFGRFAPSASVALEMYVHHPLLHIYERGVKIFISPSNFIKNKAAEWGSGIKIEILPHFINDEFNKNLVKFENKSTSILYLGRLVEEKGLLTLVEAMRLVPDARLKIAGRGPLSDKLSGANIEMVGYKTGQELDELIANSTAVVLPSKLYENYSLTVLKAMSFGIPVIASKIGGLPEMIEHGKTGLLFESGNSKDLAGQIRLLLNDVLLRQNLGRNAKEAVLKNNNAERYYIKLMEIYNNLIAAKV